MKKLLSLFLFATVLIMGACSGGGDQSQQADTSEAPESTARTIEVYGIDQMKYVVKDTTGGLQTGEAYEVNGETYYLLEGITAEVGEELNVKLTTISQLPAAAMSHNFLLLDMDTDVEAFATASIRAKDNDYVAPDLEDQVLQNSGLAAGGETVELTFSAPDQAGEYEYICSFPGHFTGGMRGILTVQPMQPTEMDS